MIPLLGRRPSKLSCFPNSFRAFDNGHYSEVQSLRVDNFSPLGDLFHQISGWRQTTPHLDIFQRGIVIPFSWNWSIYSKEKSSGKMLWNMLENDVHFSLTTSVLLTDTLCTKSPVRFSSKIWMSSGLWNMCWYVHTTWLHIQK